MLRRGSNGFRFTAMYTYLNSLKKSLNLYSTSVVFSSKDTITNPLAVEFLVKSAGFSQEEAVSVAKKGKNLLKRPANAQLVVDFLIQSGFDATEIRKLIVLYPRVLHCNVDKTLKPKFRVFRDFGVSCSNLASIIARNPIILRQNLESRIVPDLEVLKSILGSSEHVAKFMQVKQLPWLSSRLRKNMSDNLLLLQRYGLTSHKIRSIMLLRSRFLYMSSQSAGELLKRVEFKLGIPRTSGAFVYGIHAYSMKKEENINSMFELLRGHGWSETDISELFRRKPTLLCLSENNLEVKLKYFMEEHCLGSDYLAKYPELLTFSMEKRVLPRLAVRQTLMEEHLLDRPISLPSWLSMAESRFVKKYVLPYYEKFPQLYANYNVARVQDLRVL